MQTLMQDLRYGSRVLAGSPGFTLLAVLTLALAIGANTAIFSMVNAVILRPLPSVRESDELVMLVNRTNQGNDITVSYPDYRDYRDQSEAFSGLLAASPGPFSLKVDDSKAERVWGEFVSGNYFQVLGVGAALGRVFTPEDDLTPGSHPVAVISHRFWQRRFGGDPAIVGKRITLDARPFTIVGVAQEGFMGSMVGLGLDIYVPVAMERTGGSWLERRDAQWLVVLGRVRPGVALGEADAAVKTISARLRADFSDTNEDFTATLHPLWRAPIGGQQFLVPVVSILMVAVGLVLLIACSNVANLLLARAANRSREIVIRVSLGASRWRVVRQLLTESVLVALMAGGVGLLVSLWFGDFLAAQRPRSTLPIALAVTMDGTVLGFTVLLCVLAGILFGTAPALQGTKVELAAALRDQGAGAGGRRSRLRNGLVAAQVAMSLVGLVAASLLLRSLQRAKHVDPGFDPQNVLLLSIDAAPGGYDAVGGRVFYRQLLERVETLPGVRSATLSAWLPLGIAGHPSRSVDFEGYEPAADEWMSFNYNIVGPGYLHTLGTPLLEGRDFILDDNEDSRPVVIINQLMAQRYFAGQSPLGKRIRIGDTQREIVGVAKAAKYESLTEKPQAYFYLPFLQRYQSVMTLHVRTTSRPHEVQAAVETEVEKLNANLPIFDVRTLEDQITEATSQFRMAAFLLAVLSFLGLLMALVGLFGLMSYSVHLRTREIGVRMALGAQPGSVLRLVVRQGMQLVLVGVVLGLIGAVALGRILSGVLTDLLVGVSPNDPLTFVGVAFCLSAVALLACYVPARRATQVDPLVALRYE